MAEHQELHHSYESLPQPKTYYAFSNVPGIPPGTLRLPETPDQAALAAFRYERDGGVHKGIFLLDGRGRSIEPSIQRRDEALVAVSGYLVPRDTPRAFFTAWDAAADILERRALLDKLLTKQIAGTLSGEFSVVLSPREHLYLFEGSNHRFRDSNPTRIFASLARLEDPNLLSRMPIGFYELP